MISIKNKGKSVNIAKHRLHQLLYSDRINCSPEIIQQLKEDVYLTLSKYMEIPPDDFEMTLTRKEMRIKYTGEKF